MTKVCNCCGQALPERRLGVRLTPLKARIFDFVQRGGEEGIAREDLQELLDMNHAGLKSHVFQINELIKDEGYLIRCGRGDLGSFYRLVRLRAFLPAHAELSP